MGEVILKMTGGMMMTASISNKLAACGERLHRAIVDWGQRHGLRAYRVVTSEASWFEFFDPRTKEISQRFPAKIQEAIDAHADAIAAYAAATRKADQRTAARDGLIEGPRDQGTSPDPGAPHPKERGGRACDCNAESRFKSPIKSAARDVQAGVVDLADAGGSGVTSADGESCNGREVDLTAIF